MKPNKQITNSKKNLKPINSTAILVLENGTFFKGSGLGYEGVATGEVWQGEEAVKVGLVDSLETSDNYLVNLSKEAKLLEIEFVEKKNLSERLAFSMQLILEKSVIKFYDLINRDRYTS